MAPGTKQVVSCGPGQDTGTPELPRLVLIGFTNPNRLLDGRVTGTLDAWNGQNIRSLIGEGDYQFACIQHGILEPDSVIFRADNISLQRNCFVFSAHGISIE